MHRALALLLVLAVPAQADPVTRWTAIADRIGEGAANWRTLAIMHQAMHDAWNAADPRYARWFPPTADEPAPAGATAQAAMDAAAHQVLLALHPDAEAVIEPGFAAIQPPPDPASRALGEAVARAAVIRRLNDGFEVRRPFVSTQGAGTQDAGTGGAGRWRPTPDDFATSNTTDTRPFLFASDKDNPAVPPPAPGSPLYVQGVAETRRMGASDSTDRTPEQTGIAYFWAYQSSQRGFVALGARLLEQRPRPEGIAAHAQIMSQLATAMADAAILTWLEKERFAYWRPVTAIRETIPGEADWTPLIATPPHPEYPSGHATDCFTGAFTLTTVMPDVTEVTYIVQLGSPPADNVGMGQHAQARPTQQAPRRTFPSLRAAAEECYESRIWSGAHIRAANEESRRLGILISSRAAAAVPPR